MKKPKCPLCNKGIYSGVGNGCKMCGMLLEYPEEDFCCDECEDKYNKINE